MGLLHAEKIRIGKSFDPCQHARIAQAEMNRYFLQTHLAPFLDSKVKTFYAIKVQDKEIMNNNNNNNDNNDNNNN